MHLMLNKFFERVDIGPPGVGVSIIMLVYYLLQIVADPFKDSLPMEKPVFLLLAWALGLIAGGFCSSVGGNA